MAVNRDGLTIGMKSARKKITAGDFEGAIASYTEAINRRLADKRILDFVDKNRLAEAYNNCGFIKNNLGRYEEAIADCDEAIRLKPKDKNRLASAYICRGFSKNKLGRYEEALEDLDGAINLNPDDKGILASSYINRGSAKNELNRHEEAIEDFDEAIRLNPKDKSLLATGYNDRGTAKSALDRNEEAMADYDEAIRLNPADTTAWNNRGLAKHRLGKYEEAIADYDEAIRLDPKNTIALNNRTAVETQKALRESVRERVNETTEAEEFKEKAKIYELREIINRIFAYILMFVLTGSILYLIAVIIAPDWRSKILSELGSIDLSKPYNLLPWITLIIIITSPLVWLIRQLITAANKAELMKTEYEHLFIVERRMLVYFQEQDTDEGREIRADYIKTAMTNSPADKLLAFQNKASVPSPNPAQNVIENIRGKISDKV